MKVNIGCNKLTMEELAQMCGGILCCVGGETDKEIQFDSVCTDSRETAEGALFVAIDGERVNGHDYIGAAISLGTGCVLCERIPETLTDKKYAAVVVEDSIKAMGELAKAYDRRLNHRKIAITGSVGKTTTKEFVAAVLEESFKVHKTKGNFNSNIGMPLSMLSMEHDTEVSVLEMGMSDFGEIDYLSKIAEPDIAIVTNIGSSHMEHLGSRENICKAKMEIVNGLKAGGCLLLNGDEPLLRNYEGLDVTPIFVGIKSKDCDFRAVNIRSNLTETKFEVLYGGKIVKRVTIPALGEHNVYAALFAYAVGVRMGLDDETIMRGLKNFTPVGMRQNVYDLAGITVIEDCYNAAPESMSAAISVLRDIKERQGGRMMAVLGDMYELGSTSAELHEKVGLEFARMGGEVLYTFGTSANNIAIGAVLGGVLNENIYRNDSIKNPELTAQMILSTINPGDVLLVKASRGAAAERILNILKETLN
ncbi:MAG: UDP-N-acetylmuramoyl-tripeptide--D-alanyl-D-alanine ligase [Clostridia bacterium]|nr:UDP-N-acetylmuramoyl-tripeptide--D-alanyl-D-alanine ligase [Clostridia bacterium]MBO7249797.1 UDP-N-acetylmuramoyl-tripeptide--D-alanyl-D-alanine ligase [Clostridia bacterium]